MGQQAQETIDRSFNPFKKKEEKIDIIQNRPVKKNYMHEISIRLKVKKKVSD